MANRIADGAHLVYLGSFNSTTPGSWVDTQIYDLDGASIIVEENTATGDLQIEGQAVHDDATSAAYVPEDRQGDALSAIGTTQVRAIQGQHQYLRVNPNITVGSIEVWLYANYRRLPEPNAWA